jgi:flagellar basal-body rod modification protein FlgD
MSDISAAGTSTSTNPLQPTAMLPTGDTAVAGGGSGSSTSTLNGVNANTFLNLLISQLENQDPDNPTDPTQFLSETADFEEVQQLNGLQTSMASLVSAQQSSAATSMLGQQVTGSDASGNPVSGIVTGVQLTSTGPVLTVGNDSLPYSGVTGVTIPGSSTSTGTSTTGTSTTGTGTGTSGTGTGATGSSGTGSSGTGTSGNGTGSTGTGTGDTGSS